MPVAIQEPHANRSTDLSIAAVLRQGCNLAFVVHILHVVVDFSITASRLPPLRLTGSEREGQNAAPEHPLVFWIVSDVRMMSVPLFRFGGDRADGSGLVAGQGFLRCGLPSEDRTVGWLCSSFLMFPRLSNFAWRSWPRHGLETSGTGTRGRFTDTAASYICTCKLPPNYIPAA
jgi:hypothetical protein